MTHNYQARSGICNNCNQIFYNNNRNGRDSIYCSITCRKEGCLKKFLQKKRLLTQLKKRYKLINKLVLVIFLEVQSRSN